MTTPADHGFGVKRKLWSECLAGEDRHSIVRQIAAMVWNAAAFRIVNEARRIAPSAEQGGVQLNGLMHTLIDDCFFESQMLAIRRLTDSYPITGDPRRRDVFSLTSLLRDMEENAHLITRSNLFAAEGLEYDLELLRQKERDYHLASMAAGERAYFLPGSVDSLRSQRRHEEVDFLAGVAETQRTRGDSVRRGLLTHLRNKLLKACEQIRSRVDKFVAHAASPASRQRANAEDVAVTLNHIWEAHKVIAQIANFLDVYVLTGTSHGFLATPQYDQFAYIDRPLVASGAVAHLGSLWEEYDKETKQWSRWGIDELRDEMA